MGAADSTSTQFMREALRLARRGFGRASPNPMVGAVLVKADRIIGRGWHRRAGEPHAEVEALRDAQERGNSARGGTLFVTLEPCCTHGHTPPCTEAIIAAGIRRVVIGAVDPNPRHAGKALKILRRAGIEVLALGGDLAAECAGLNEAFNHWIVHRTPFVTVKAAMTLDGKIATATGESKWITGEPARAVGLRLRRGSDAVLVGVNTILADDPSLTARRRVAAGGSRLVKPIRRFILDSQARTPLTAQVLNDGQAGATTIVVSRRAPKKRVTRLAQRVNVLVAPLAQSGTGNRQSAINLCWLLRKLGADGVTSLLVEGGGEVNASFLLGGFAQRVAFFYSPKIIGGRAARRAVAGDGVSRLADALTMTDIRWRRVGVDLLLTARTKPLAP